MIEPEKANLALASSNVSSPTVMLNVLPVPRLVNGKANSSVSFLLFHSLSESMTKGLSDPPLLFFSPQQCVQRPHLSQSKKYTSFLEIVNMHYLFFRILENPPSKGLAFVFLLIKRIFAFVVFASFRADKIPSSLEYKSLRFARMFNSSALISLFFLGSNSSISFFM